MIVIKARGAHNEFSLDKCVRQLPLLLLSRREKLCKIHVLSSNSACALNIYANYTNYLISLTSYFCAFFLDKIWKLLTYHTPSYP